MAHETENGADAPADVVRVVDFLRMSLRNDEAEQALDPKVIAVAERREKVLDLYRRLPLQEVAKQLQISTSTAFGDIKAILDSTRRRMLLHSTELLVHMVSELTDLERDIREQWERSKKDGKKTVTKVKGKLSSKPGTKKGDAQEQKTTGTEKEDHTEVIERIGDPRLAALLLSIHQRKCKLLGLETDEKPEDKEPPVKVLSESAWGAV